MSIEVKDIVKTFGEFTALKSVSLHIPTGGLMALLGPSGSGKTTLLRVIAGLEAADAGSVLFHGQDTESQKIRERKVGFVFQHYALFRHMTVFENVAFGLKVKPRHERPSKSEIQKKVGDLLKLVQLDKFGARYPHQLSGGQRQRVALARALAIEPKVLLLDEPFGALDAKVRQELRTWLRRLHDEIHVTSVFVTHDVEEALEVADQVVVMNEGRIEQIGTPEEVYHHPASPFVFNFLGNVNFFHCRVENGMAYIGEMSMKLPDHVNPSAKTAKVYVRPHLFDLDKQPVGTNFFKGRVKHINPAGAVAKVEVLSEWGDLVNVEVPLERYQILQLKKDDDVYVRPKELKVFNQDYSI